MHLTNISEAKANLSRLIEQTQSGKSIIIGKAGKPVAVLSPYNESTAPGNSVAAGSARSA